MEPVIREILCADKDSHAKIALFKDQLATGGTQGQRELIQVLLENLALDPAGGVQCLSTCFISARPALREQLLDGARLAGALAAAGDRAPSVADLAAIVLKATPFGASASTSTRVLARTSAELWPALVRLGGVSRWEELPPTHLRAAVVRLWSRCPALGPGDQTSAAPLVQWLADPAAQSLEQAQLYKEVGAAWGRQGAVVNVRVEDSLGGLLRGLGNFQSADLTWLATVIARPPAATTSPWMCPLLAGISAAALAATGAILDAPGGKGPAILFFAWATLYGAALAALSSAGPAEAEVVGSLPAVLQLLSDLTRVLARRSCWPELASALLCVTLHWPSDGNLSGERHPSTDVGLEAWAAFARRVLLDLPDEYPESPLAGVLQLILATVPRPPAHGRRAALAEDFAAELRRRASCPGLTAGGGTPGLRNLGNTCYLNSFLQALGLTHGFAATLFSPHSPLVPRGGAADEAQSSRQEAIGPSKGAAVRVYLAEVLTRLAVSRAAVSPSALAKLTPFGLDGRQQDVTELARWLLDQVGDVATEGSVTERSFGGRARTRVRCTGCGLEHDKVESFSDLCLPVTAAVPTGSFSGGDAPPQLSVSTVGSSVARLLQLYLCEEALAGYRCDGCGATDKSKRHCEFIKAPEHLIVSLGRFAYTPDGGQRKLDAHVGVEASLELPLAADLAGAGGAAGCPPASYSLYAMVTHAGSTPNSGHYVCLGRGSESAADSAWSCFDDCSVRALSAGASQEELDRRANGIATAYMLFYRRQGQGPEVRPPAPRQLPAKFFAEAVLAELAGRGLDAGHEGGRLVPRPAPLGGAPPGAGPGNDGLGPSGGGALGGGGWVC